MDLAKRGFVHMNHSRETLDSSPGRSVQCMYVCVCVCLRRHTEECVVHVDKMP